MKRYLLITLLLSLAVASSAQTAHNSAIRGTVVDKQSQFPLPGVTVILLDSEPMKGIATDIDGHFRLEDVPVGRHAIQISFIGYEPQVLSNLLLTSGKELEVNVQLVESINQVDVVEVVAKDNKHEALNKMSTVSARSFSIEEAQRYSGALQDPSRMAQNFAGVSNASDDRNDIIIRGNSPTGVLWRMEGIDIPSPNHFGTLGTTGGPVSMLNINNLANSDFMTSAFAAEYGNALAGVFDLQLRNGNKDNHEFLGQIGFNGFELGAEGPLPIGRNASFLVNYRYSTLGVLNALGVEFGTGSAIPEYQDLTFKLDIPTDKLGRFSVFGVGGTSFIDFKASEAGDNNLYSDNQEDSQFGSDTGWLGISHQYFFSENTKSKLVIAASHAGVTGFVDSLSTVDSSPNRIFGLDNRQTKYSANLSVNSKLNAKNTIKVGAIYDHYSFNVQDSVLWSPELFFYRMDFDGDADMMQGYANWQHRFSEKISMNLGLHSQHFLYNESNAIEPRLGVKYQMNDAHALSFGSGMHSQLQPITVYFNEYRFPDNSSELRNTNLGFNKSMHFVLAHDWLATEHFRIKSEVYYQHLYDFAVDRESTSFSMLNTGADFNLPDNGELTNDGTGANYGLELTLERFFHDGFYALFTASLFESEYEGSDGVRRNTAFNGNYVFNTLGGKEFKVGKSNTLSFDTKVTLAGGRWFTPIDLEESIALGEEVRNDEQAFSKQYDPYFRLDFKVTYRMNKSKFAQQFAVDFRNLTGHENIFLQSYNARTQQIDTTYQIGFFPDVQWKMYF